MAKTFGFDEDGTRRVVKTVRKVEGQPPAPAVGRRKRPPSSGFAQALAKADGPIANNDSGFAIIWTGEPLSESATPERVKLANRFATVADQAWLWIENNGSGWYVVALAPRDLAVFYLNENLPQFGSAGAQICEWNDPVWTPGAGDAITVYDICGSGPADLQTFGIAWLAPSGRWEIIELGGQGHFLVPFYLDAPLTKGGSTSATITTPSAGLSTLWPADGANITVHDVVGRFGPAAIGKRGVAGRIVVDNDPANDVYVIFSLDADKPALQLYLFYLNAPLTKGSSASANLREWAAPPLVGGPWAASGGAVTVYDSSSLGPAPQGTDATKHSGVCWLNPDSGRYEIIACNRSAMLWAKATAKWTNAAGNASTVACNMCSDKTGTLVLDGMGAPIPLTVYLPRPDGGTKKATDPNVQTGDVIGYVIEDGGDCICNSDVNDGCLRSVKWWNDAAGNIPRGWRELTGAAGRFIVAVGPGEPPDFDATGLGYTGGTTKHKHQVTAAGTIATATTGITATGSGSGTLSGGGVTGSGTSAVTLSASTGGTTINTSSALTGITLDDHDGHYHGFSYGTGTAQSGAGQAVNHSLSGATTMELRDGSTTVLWHIVHDDGHVHTIAKTDISDSITGSVNISNIASGLSITGSVNISSLSISITDPGHSHTFTGTSVDTNEKYHIPPFYALYLIERFE